MAEDTETKAQPTVAELEAKEKRIANQVAEDTNATARASDAFAKAVKSGNVDQALELADARGKAQATLAKNQSQLKTAQNAVKSAQHAANHDRILSVEDSIRGQIASGMEKLEALGVTKISIERSEETGKLLINSAGPTVKRTRAPGGGGGGGRGEPLTVDGQSFDSASAALTHHRPDFEGKMGRSAIVSWLVNAGHEVS